MNTVSKVGTTMSSALFDQENEVQNLTPPQFTSPKLPPTLCFQQAITGAPSSSSVMYKRRRSLPSFLSCVCCRRNSVCNCILPRPRRGPRGLHSSKRSEWAGAARAATECVVVVWGGSRPPTIGVVGGVRRRIVVCPSFLPSLLGECKEEEEEKKGLVRLCLCLPAKFGRFRFDL